MKYFLFLGLLILFTFCRNKKITLNKPTQTSNTVAANAAINYDSCKRAIALLKRKTKNTWAILPHSEKEKIITYAITNTIIPAWIGTPWDFNGVTQIPQHGKIACGYFVTTVLQHAGFNIARVKLAQYASEQMITNLVQPKYIQRFSNIPMQNFLRAIPKNSIALYIIGLDNHTGFIYNDGKEIYFIHSTFVGSRNVQKEIAADSWVLQQSKYKVLARLSADERQLNKWVQ
jgi:hypothetical protein